MLSVLTIGIVFGYKGSPPKAGVTPPSGLPRTTGSKAAIPPATPPIPPKTTGSNEVVPSTAQPPEVSDSSTTDDKKGPPAAPPAISPAITGHNAEVTPSTSTAITGDNAVASPAPSVSDSSTTSDKHTPVLPGTPNAASSYTPPSTALPGASDSSDKNAAQHGELASPIEEETAPAGQSEASANSDNHDAYGSGSGILSASVIGAVLLNSI